MSAIFSVNGTQGLMKLVDGSPDGTLLLNGVDVAECEVSFSMTVVTGGGDTVTVGAYYRAALDLATFFKAQFVMNLASNQITLIAVRDETGPIGSVVTAIPFTPGTPMNVRIRSTSAQFVRVWSSLVTEPTTWNLATGTGSTKHGTAGLNAFGFRTTPMLVTIAFDDFQVLACEPE
jgi:hypothetical protein